MKRNTNPRNNIPGGTQKGDSMHNPNVHNQITEIRSILSDLSNQIKALVSEYKNNKPTASLTNQQKDKLTNTTQKNKNQLSLKKQKAQDDLNKNGRRLWNAVNLFSSSETELPQDPFLTKLDSVINVIQTIECHVNQIDDIRATYVQKIQSTT